MYFKPNISLKLNKSIVGIIKKFHLKFQFDSPEMKMRTGTTSPKAIQELELK